MTGCEIPEEVTAASKNGGLLGVDGEVIIARVVDSGQAYALDADLEITACRHASCR
jgi:hypothetical protein